MPMNTEIKAQWTAALRSGEYVQGRGFLNAAGKLCCLGVLCELAVKAGIIEASEAYDAIYYDGKADTLPFTVVKWAGLPDKDVPNLYNPQVAATGADGITQGVSLAELNDGENGWRYHTFGEIADLIDAQI